MIDITATRVMATRNHPPLITLLLRGGLGLVGMCLFSPLSAAAAVSVEVMETFPAPSVRALAVDQSFYVHIRYASETPLRIHVRPVTRDEEGSAINGGSVLLPPGSGETLGWFALRAPGVVNEYRIAVDAENIGYPKDVLAVPITLEWKQGGVMTDTGRPDWVATINQRNEALWKAEQKNAEMDSPFLNLMLGLLLMPLLFGIPLLAIALSIVALVRWTGPWRHAGGLPLVFFAIWLVLFIFDLTRDPTSHNLWPFEMLYWAGLTLAWLFALFVARKFIARKAAG